MRTLVAAVSACLVILCIQTVVIAGDPEFREVPFDSDPPKIERFLPTGGDLYFQAPGDRLYRLKDGKAEVVMSGGKAFDAQIDRDPKYTRTVSGKLLVKNVNSAMPWDEKQDPVWLWVVEGTEAHKLEVGDGGHFEVHPQSTHIATAPQPGCPYFYWKSARHTGLYEIGGTKAVPVELPDGVVVDQLAYCDGKTLVSHWDGDSNALYLLEEGKFTEIKTADGNSVELLRRHRINFCADYIWVMQSGDILHLDGTTVTATKLEDQSSILWVASFGETVFARANVRLESRGFFVELDGPKGKEWKPGEQIGKPWKIFDLEYQLIGKESALLMVERDDERVLYFVTDKRAKEVKLPRDVVKVHPEWGAVLGDEYVLPVAVSNAKAVLAHVDDKGKMKLLENADGDELVSGGGRGAVGSDGFYFCGLDNPQQKTTYHLVFRPAED